MKGREIKRQCCRERYIGGRRGSEGWKNGLGGRASMRERERDRGREGGDGIERE